MCSLQATHHTFATVRVEKGIPMAMIKHIVFDLNSAACDASTGDGPILITQHIRTLRTRRLRKRADKGTQRFCGTSVNEVRSAIMKNRTMAAILAALISTLSFGRRRFRPLLPAPGPLAEPGSDERRNVEEPGVVTPAVAGVSDRPWRIGDEVIWTCSIRTPSPSTIRSVERDPLGLQTQNDNEQRVQDGSYCRDSDISGKLHGGRTCYRQVTHCYLVADPLPRTHCPPSHHTCVWKADGCHRPNPGNASRRFTSLIVVRQALVRHKAGDTVDDHIDCHGPANGQSPDGSCTFDLWPFGGWWQHIYYDVGGHDDPWRSDC